MDDDTADETSLDRAETQFQDALRANDVAALDRRLHDDACFTGPDGVTIDKATDLSAHRSQTLILTRVDELDRQVQVIDTVGITRATLHLAGTADGRQIDAVLAYTRVWVWSEAGWLIIAAHGGAGATA